MLTDIFATQYVKLLHDSHNQLAAGKEYRRKVANRKLQLLNGNFDDMSGLSYKNFKQLAVAVLNSESKLRTGFELSPSAIIHVERLLVVMRRSYKKNDSKISNKIMRFLRVTLLQTEQIQSSIVDKTEAYYREKLKDEIDYKVRNKTAWNCEYLNYRENECDMSTKYTDRKRAAQFNESVLVQLFEEFSSTLASSVSIPVVEVPIVYSNEICCCSALVVYSDSTRDGVIFTPDTETTAPAPVIATVHAMLGDDVIVVDNDCDKETLIDGSPPLSAAEHAHHSVLDATTNERQAMSELSGRSIAEGCIRHFL